MTLVGDKPDKKIILTDNYERLGELYIEAEIIKMGNHNEGRYGSFFMNRKKLKANSQSK